MIIYDFFAGTGSATKAFEDRGHKVIKVELDESFEADERDILTLNADYLIEKYGRPDFIWASPPCTTFSVASLRLYWQKGPNGVTPKNTKVYDALKVVEHTLNLINELKPNKGWLMENPRGMLRTQSIMKGLSRRTISYCQYGDYRMKPTDLWGNVPNWQPKPICKPKSLCHEPAPRGAVSGTQRLKNPKLRSMVPYALGLEIEKALND